MTYTTEELWEPVPLEGGLPASTGIESVFLFPEDRELLDAELEERRTRAPIGFAPAPPATPVRALQGNVIRLRKETP